MIIGFCSMFILFGMSFLLCQYYLPPIPGMITSIQLMGAMFIGIGIIVLVVRDHATGGGYWMDLPHVDHTICIHSQIANKRLDPNAKFIVAKDIGLGLLKAKNKVFKDTGGGFRIAGHDVRRTHEKLAADIPEWAGQYFYQIKQKWKCSNEEEMKEMYDILRKIKPPIPGVMSILDQLGMHKIFYEALQDPVSKAHIEKMSIDDIHNMTEYLFDAETVHMEDVEYFINLAKPNELDTWIDQEVTRGERERKTYRDPAKKIDWNSIALPLGIFFILAILGTVILLSYLGS
jgi:hypothetical protein